MTDIFNNEEEKKAQQSTSFKERILADMKKASRLRRRRVSQSSEDEKNSHDQKSKDFIRSAKNDELESASVMSVPDGKITNQDVDDVLANLDEIFSPDHLEKDTKKKTFSRKTKSEPTNAEKADEVVQKEQSKLMESVEDSNSASEDLEVKVQQTNNWVDDGEAENWQAADTAAHKEKQADDRADEKTKDLSSLPNAIAAQQKEIQKTSEENQKEDIDKTNQEADDLSDNEKMKMRQGSPNRQQRNKKTRTLARKISTVIISLIIILLLATGIFGYFYVSSAIKPLDTKSTKYIQVEIPSGSGNKKIGKILEKAGLIKNGTIFSYYVKFRNYGNLQSGYYNFQKSMSVDDIAKALKLGGTTTPQAPTLGKVLIPEGYSIKQIAKAITNNANSKKKSAKTPFSSKEFLKTVQDKTFINKMVKKYPKLLASLPDASKVNYQLEGYLFPATYSYEKSTTVEGLIDNMLSAMDTNLQSYYSTIEQKGKTVNEILTMASLVEKEGATDDDRKKIAGVFNNRIKEGMPLQSNIAVLYAMNKLGKKTSLKEDAKIDTKIDSPYNVYVHKGLMPGAVDNPGLSAIKAAVEPDATDNLYFVADVTTGEVYYAKTYEEHSANVEKYVNKKLKSSSE
ncbi:putative aminodeoxychorismate lyase [Streptococcus macacae NCTC 11558]|uniref:Endolytic murein transglycosylase n=2 Tax=Streptococcus macacae TaxID=1339 RepID=G5JY63_9STRE|nr:endolytic transglycosylase MltG [Streptococcus macacae]EHJ52993.1 YceG family protein [Streptococcus macacae NCTC 11558]SUN77978.1 putative aminodeoxychorismate lyase [Streptococcus macacae NCTC 11558]